MWKVIRDSTTVVLAGDRAVERAVSKRVETATVLMPERQRRGCMEEERDRKTSRACSGGREGKKVLPLLQMEVKGEKGIKGQGDNGP